MTNEHNKMTNILQMYNSMVMNQSWINEFWMNLIKQFSQFKATKIISRGAGAGAVRSSTSSTTGPGRARARAPYPA